MKRKLTLIIIASLLFSAAGVLPAVDFGGSLDNSTAFGTYATGYLDQQDRLSAWFNTGTENDLVFSIMGSFAFGLYVGDPLYYSARDPEDIKPSLLLDIDDLRLYGTYPTGQDGTGRFSFQLGRYRLTDPTRYIIDHKLDGVAFMVGNPRAKVSAAFGFTGLYFLPSSSIYLSRADINAARSGTVILATPRLAGSFQLDLPQLFVRQTLSLAFLFQEDLRGLAEIETQPPSAVVLDEGETTEFPNRGGRVDTQYLLLRFSGPIISDLFYSTFFALGTGRELAYIGGVYAYNPILSFLTGLDVHYYLEELLFSRFSAGFVLASGDSDKSSFYEGNTAGNSSMFLPISEATLAQIFDPRLGNIAVAQLSYSLKPLSFLSNDALNNFQAVLSGLMFFRTTDGPVSEGGLDAASTGNYLGTEIDLELRFRPFSDLGVAATTGLFIPSDAFAAPLNTARFEQEIEFSFSF